MSSRPTVASAYEAGHWTGTQEHRNHYESMPGGLHSRVGLAHAGTGIVCSPQQDSFCLSRLHIPPHPIFWAGHLEIISQVQSSLWWVSVAALGLDSF